MIRFSRAFFFQYSNPFTFCLMRKNLSESTAVKPDSEINKLENQESISNELGAQKKNELPLLDKWAIEERKSSALDFHPLKVSAFKRIYDEQEAEDFTKNLSTLQIIQAMKIITVSKSRPPVLLKSLSSKLKVTNDVYDYKSCADIFYYSASLNFKDANLFNKLSDSLLSCKDTIPEVYIRKILLSCGKLKYRNCGLIDFLLAKLLYSKKYSNKSLLNGLITLGIVNYMSVYGAVIANELLKLSDKEFPLSKIYIDFVWACILINQFPVEHIQYVLSNDFIEHIKNLYGSTNYFTPVAYKLHNINAAAIYLLPDYKGPVLQTKLCGPFLNKNTNVQFRSSVIDGLSHIFPKNGYLATNVDTKSGFFIDIECYMDKNCNPVPLKKMEGVKIGIMLLQFNDTCLGNEKSICGITAFKEKIFQAQGYKVVRIFEDEYNANLKLYDKVAYLREKLKTCVTS